ncbi:MAG: hypothetical protein CML56_00075, partial [Rhodobacteraceae bacterium]|nr:hypothetical protein [Paracoccaceae bacterium]
KASENAERGLHDLKKLMKTMAVAMVVFAILVRGIQMLKIDWTQVGAFMLNFSVFIGQVITVTGVVILLNKLKISPGDFKEGMKMLGLAATFIGTAIVVVSGILVYISELPPIDSKQTKTVLTAVSALVNNAIKMVVAVAVSLRLMDGLKQGGGIGKIALGLALISGVIGALAYFTPTMIDMITDNGAIGPEKAKSAEMIARTTEILVNNAIKMVIAGLPMALIAMAPFPLNLVLGGAMIAGMMAIMEAVRTIGTNLPPIIKALLTAVPNDSPSMISAKTKLLEVVLNMVVELGKMIMAISAAAPKEQTMLSSKTMDMTPMIRSLKDFFVGTPGRPGLLPEMKTMVLGILSAAKGLTEPQIKSAAATGELISAVANLMSALSGPMGNLDTTLYTGTYGGQGVAETSEAKMRQYTVQTKRLFKHAKKFITEVLGDLKELAGKFPKDPKEIDILDKRMGVMVKMGKVVASLGNMLSKMASAKVPRQGTRVQFMRQMFDGIRMHIFGNVHGGKGSFEMLMDAAAKVKVPRRGMSRLGTLSKAVEKVGKFIEELDKTIAIIQPKAGIFDQAKDKKSRAAVVTDMVGEVNQIAAAMANIGEGATINANLKKLGSALGIKKENIKIQHKPFSVTLNLDISMDVKDIAKPLVKGKYFYMDGGEVGGEGGKKVFAKINEPAFRGRV